MRDQEELDWRVIPAKAGIQYRHALAFVILDTGLRRYDEVRASSSDMCQRIDEERADRGMDETRAP
jgi:hypothetical protein